MDLNTAANALRELGHPTRLSIYRELVRAGHEGLPVGELQKHLEIPASTLSHHLSALISAGLISQERQSRTLFCRPCYAQQAIDGLSDRRMLRRRQLQSVTRKDSRRDPIVNNLTDALKNIDPALLDAPLTEDKLKAREITHPPRILMLYGSLRARSTAG